MESQRENDQNYKRPTIECKLFNVRRTASLRNSDLLYTN